MLLTCFLLRKEVVDCLEKVCRRKRYAERHFISKMVLWVKMLVCPWCRGLRGVR